MTEGVWRGSAGDPRRSDLVFKCGGKIVHLEKLERSDLARHVSKGSMCRATFTVSPLVNVLCVNSDDYLNTT